MPDTHIRLFTPGPGEVDEDVLAAMAQPIMRHYGPEWIALFDETLGLLKQIFGTRHDLFIVPGPASAMLDMAIGSVVPSGEQIVVGRNGFFGERLAAIAESYGLEAIEFSAPLGQPLDPDLLRALLGRHPRARAVALVHHETGTTVLNPLRELVAVAREAGRIVIVDAVSSLGGVVLPVDDWGIDICASASTKCLEGPAGLGFISVSPRAWAVIDAHGGAGHGWYLDLRTWRKYAREWGSWHPTPVTVPSNNLLASLTSLRKIAHVGLDAHIAKYARASRRVRSALTEMGFEMFVPEPWASPVVTGVKGRPEFEVRELLAWLIKERRIAVGGGLGELAGKMFRIGHLGKAATPEYLDDLLSAIEAFLGK